MGQIWLVYGRTVRLSIAIVGRLNCIFSCEICIFLKLNCIISYGICIFSDSADSTGSFTKTYCSDRRESIKKDHKLNCDLDSLFFFYNCLPYIVHNCLVISKFKL